MKISFFLVFFVLPSIFVLGSMGENDFQQKHLSWIFIWYGCFLGCKMSRLYHGTCSKHSWHRTLILIYDGLEVYCCAVWAVNDPVATELLLRKFMLPQTDFNPWVINHFKLKLVQTFQMRFPVFLAHFLHWIYPLRWYYLVQSHQTVPRYLEQAPLTQYLCAVLELNMVLFRLYSGTFRKHHMSYPPFLSVGYNQVQGEQWRYLWIVNVPTRILICKLCSAQKLP